MAPVFGESLRPNRPRKEATGGGFNVEKPAFTFNAQPSTQSNGFFRSLGPPVAQHSGQASSMEDGWDMGGDDDGSDETSADVDDSRLQDYDNEMEESLYKPELTAFATRLDESQLLRPNMTIEENSAAAFSLIKAFQEFATENVEETGQMVEELENSRPEAGDERRHAHETLVSKDMLQYWEMEHQTWELFGALIAHRLDSVNYHHDDMNILLQLANDKFVSDSRVRETFFQTDKSFRELSIVLEWLRRYSPGPTADEIETNELYRGDRGWMYTKEKIKASKRLRPGKQLSLLGGNARSAFMPAPSKRNIVTELDPDAPSRQQCHLEEEDEAWERYLMKLVWGFLRKGQVADAQDLCEDAGEFWRAASLSGGQDAWDSKIDGSREDQDNSRVTGNRRRELWKRMCFAIARRRGGNEYEKAVYGSLCGDIESVLPVCGTWEDLLFAHVNSLVEGYYSNMLAKLSRIPAVVSKFPAFDAIAYHARGTMLGDEGDDVMSRVIDEIASNDNIKDSRHHLRTIQGSLISLRFHDLVIELDRQLRLFEEIPDYDLDADDLSTGLDATDVRLLRVVVHLIMILQALNAGFQEGSEYHRAAENVIAGYILTLGEFDKLELVPLYASRLTTAKAISVVGKTLVAFQGDKSQREEMVRLMHIHGVDVDGCLKNTMEQSLQMTEHHYKSSTISKHGIVFNGFAGELLPEDQKLIRGLEWLMLGSDALQGDLVTSACEVYKRFLFTGRLTAAKALHTKVNSKKIIPPETNDFAVGGDAMDIEISEMFSNEETRLAAAIYFNIEALIGSMIALDEWRTASTARPDRADRSFGRKLKPFYEAVSRTLPDVVKTFLDDTLLHALPDVPRIRSLYVPEMVLALHRVHVEAATFIHKGLIMHALELAAEVADPERSILDTFRDTGRLEEYVDEIAAASRAMLGVGQEGTKELGIWNVQK